MSDQAQEQRIDGSRFRPLADRQLEIMRTVAEQVFQERAASPPLTEERIREIVREELDAFRAQLPATLTEALQTSQAAGDQVTP